MKKSGWSIAGVLAYLAIRFGVVAMRHPDWNSNDWAGFLGITATLLVVVFSIIWLVKKARAPKPLAAPPIANGSTVSVPALPTVNQPPKVLIEQPQSQTPPALPYAPPVGRVCARCSTQFDPDAHFCQECGALVA